MVIRERGAMIAGMAPARRAGVWHFCSVSDPAVVARALPCALGLFREDEGVSLILPEEALADLGLAPGLAMACLTLTVHSALDGVGLTAAVAGALAAADIPCNMVAGHHHDHVFVPVAQAEAALAVLAARAAAG